MDQPHNITKEWINIVKKMWHRGSTKKLLPKSGLTLSRKCGIVDQPHNITKEWINIVKKMWHHGSTTYYYQRMD